MKKLIALVVAAFMLAGCGNFVTDFGIPTVRFHSVSFGPSASGYEVIFEVQPLPGSPSAYVAQLNLTGGPALSGFGVPECPPSTAADDCPKQTQNLTFAANPGTLAITGYVAQSLNGTVRTVTLPAPVVINP
ncbi:hypothetical protein [Meiothermus hypogaeus]|uniref:Lipoprotein n=2 Tax=Meiothermus hypogaeus TaxID=884155 RepID=A0A511R1J2_9DEIN|nr:hypothetical protein [Meiothermus hypogaeus]RIH76163.1 hypothetical protein Mhypo_02588 [Meiothermus hypogaeus]GEM83475.1 hypothetical protein MHY01S_16410 [Meiothermus hypogaeus NBRC 106114]